MIPYFFIGQFSIGQITIHVWGLFVALGIMCGTIFAAYRASSRKIEQYIIVDLVFWTTLASVIGAMIAFVLFNGKNETLGFSSIGAIIAGSATVFVIAKIKKISISSLLDILGPAVLLAEGIGRIGCFMLHEHLGKITGSVLGINIFGENRHDLGLYFSLAGFAGLFFVLMLERVWKKWAIGGIGAIAILWYLSWRFLLEFLLESNGPLAVEKIHGLTLMQIFSIFVIIFINWYFFPYVPALRRF